MARVRRMDAVRSPRVSRALLIVLALPLVGQLALVAAGAARANVTIPLVAAETLLALFAIHVWRREFDRLRRIVAGLPTDPPRLPEFGLIGSHVGLNQGEAKTRFGALQRALRAEKAIIEQLPESLLLVNGDGAVARMNEAARQHLGGDIPAVLRHPLLRGAIDKALATNAAQAVDLLFAAPVPRELHATVMPLDARVFAGNQVSILLVDHTRERAIERMRADFVANASHELRTPLASLIGFTETLQGPARDDPQARERFLEIMAQQGARMNRLIDDLLSLSRIELSEHQPPQGRIDFTLLVPRAVAAFEPRILERGVQLDLTLADLPPIPGDADQMAQVLANLLDNALKYGREGGCVSLSVALASGAPWPSPPGVVLSVGDDGAGISRAHLPRLTERFYRVDKGRSRAVGGTGLGLAIVKHIITRHRGQLIITSEEGRGSRFSVWLPC